MREASVSEADVLDLALAHRIVVRSGTWLRYEDIQLDKGGRKHGIS